MNILALFWFLFLALFGVTSGRISFSCKKIHVDHLRLKEKNKCRDNHLKNFFSRRDKGSVEYKCCMDYVYIICDNKVFVKCLSGSPENQEPLKSRPECRPATELPCSKDAEKDWFDEDDVKNNGKPQSSNDKQSSAGKPAGSKGEKPGSQGGSKSKSSRAEHRSKLLLISALFFL